MSASSIQQGPSMSARVALTPRQFAVGALVAQGLTNAEVAHRLGLSVATVKVYRREAMQRLGATSPVQLVRHFLGVPASAAVGDVTRLVQPLQVHVVEPDEGAGRALVLALRQRGIPTRAYASAEALLQDGPPCQTDVVLLALSPRPGPLVERADFSALAEVRQASPCGLLALLPAYRAPHATQAREQGGGWGFWPSGRSARVARRRHEPVLSAGAWGRGRSRLAGMARKTAHVSETPATQWLKAHGVSHTGHAYEYVDHGGTAESARQLGWPEHYVIKTLVMEDERGDPLIVLMHGDRQVSTKNLARAISAKAVQPCRPEVAQRHSGYMVGGTSPFGTRKAMPVYVEAGVLALPRILINGGRRGFLVEIDPTVLVDVLGARPVQCALG